MNTHTRPISRRSFIQNLGACAAFATFAPWGMNRLQAASTGSSLIVDHPALPYAADALEPYIDAKTMEIHHGRHHAAYVRGFNISLEQWIDCPYNSLEAVFANMNQVPESILNSVRNNGGGAWNHELFWELMSPEPSVPGGDFLSAVQRDFGSAEQMKIKFKEAAMSRFGSGWAWLCLDSDGNLFITSTPNQDNPLMNGLVDRTGLPLLGLDVWEHAYYLHYQNRRGDYVDAFWNVVNWRKVQSLYLASMTS